MAAAKKKRTTLPKDFEEKLESAKLATLQRVFEICEIDARDKYSQQTTFIMSSCPNALARWLVDQGANVNAVDHYGNNALHIAVRRLYKPRNLGLLIKLGCDVSAREESGNTPLHEAADAKNVNAVEYLLAAGAKVDATNRERLTPLALGLRGCTNAGIEDMVPVARALLAAGARRTPAMGNSIQRIGKSFEFHRAGFAKGSVKATSAALLELCELFSVQPPSRRVIHDGKAVITVNGGKWQKQHDELWEFLVPSRGAAATVQGEVIRISGRICGEIYRNGGGNWNSDFTKMARAYLEIVRSETSLDDASILEAEKIVDSIIKRRGDAMDDDYEQLSKLAVEWVRRNPKPFKLGKVAYKL